MSLSVLVVDDHMIVREMLAILVGCDDRFSLLGTADNGRHAVELARQECPDVIVCDVNMPGMDGLQAVEKLRALCPGGSIVMYTADPLAASDALCRGADRVFDKSGDPTAMLEELVLLGRQHRRIMTVDCIDG